MNFEISFDWVPVQSSKNTSYSFPEPASNYLRKQYGQPAIYHWLIEGDGETSIYIGETENLGRRLYHYLKTGSSQKTNQRVRALLGQKLADGASIRFDVLGVEPFVINGREYSSEKLWEKEVRCFLENLLITQLPLETKKLNRLVSVQEKAVHRAVKFYRPKLSSEQLGALTGTLMKQMKLLEK